MIHEGTALIEAIQSKDANRVRKLLAAGCPLSARDAQGRPALVLAARSGNPELVRALLEAGANPNVEKRLKRPSSFRLRRTVAGPIAFPDDGNSSGDGGDGEGFAWDLTPLRAALSSRNLEVVQQLLRAGAEVNPRRGDRESPLVIAARMGEPALVRALLEAGSEVDRDFDETPLEAAARNGHAEVVALLLEAGADVDREDEDGATALLTACAHGHLEVVKVLVEAGAAVEYWSQGDSPLTDAVRHREVYEYLRPRVSDPGMLAKAEDLRRLIETQTARRSASPAVKRVIELAEADLTADVEREIAAGADVNALGEDGMTALMAAALHGSLSTIEALLAAGADPNAPADQPSGMAALHYAAASVFTERRAEVLRALLGAGADPDLQDRKGRTALLRAVEGGFCGFPDSLRALIEAGADLNRPDAEGRTPLRVAIERRLTVISELRVTALMFLREDPPERARACQEMLAAPEEEAIDRAERMGLDPVLVRRGRQLTAMIDLLRAAGASERTLD